MPTTSKENSFNPDVLSCLANLSSDEVFTPPKIVNDMLDMLPQKLFSDPNATFLDPACKTGVFLREIAKRLIEGLEQTVPDLNQRLEHIYRHQLFGIGMTEITALMSRRSLYCSKYADGDYSVVKFQGPDGNIRYKRIKHTWSGGSCIFCGASQEKYQRNTGLESHAYEFIHKDNSEGIFKMKFDVIIGNPPYQLDTTKGSGKQAKPIYNLFVEQAKKLNPRFLIMIIPSRWFAGGMGLDKFRSEMIQDRHITKIVDYVNAKDCFPQNSISGGVCYFLRERDRLSDCQFTNINNGQETTMIRPLNEFSTLVRYNNAIPILHKVRALAEPLLDTITSPLMPYGITTDVRGEAKRTSEKQLVLHASNGITYIDPSLVTNGIDTINKYKILISATSAEHACEPGKDGYFKVLTSSLKVIGPGEVCTHSYFTIGQFDDINMAKNLLSYIKTRFVRFLMLLSMSSIHLSKLVFSFIPLQNLSKPWTDKELYQKYGLTEDEILFIESLIKLMDQEETEDVQE
jgi:site-specific DNA-methyltransferase (adenine-specific)